MTLEQLKRGDILTDERGNSIEVLAAQSMVIQGRLVGIIPPAAHYFARETLEALPLTVTTLETRLQETAARLAKFSPGESGWDSTKQVLERLEAMR
jgi:hypothetical protein